MVRRELRERAVHDETGAARRVPVRQDERDEEDLQLEPPAPPSARPRLAVTSAWIGGVRDSAGVTRGKDDRSG